MIQSGGVIRDIPILGSIFSNLAEKVTDIARDLEKDCVDKNIDKFGKEYITGEGSGIKLRKMR